MYKSGKAWLTSIVDRLRKEQQLDFDPLRNPPNGLHESSSGFPAHPRRVREMVWAMGYDKDFAKRVEDSTRFKRWVEDGKRNRGLPKPLSEYFGDMTSDEWRELLRDKLIRVPGSSTDVQDQGNFMSPRVRKSTDNPDPRWWYLRPDEPPITGADGRPQYFEEWREQLEQVLSKKRKAREDDQRSRWARERIGNGDLSQQEFPVTWHDQWFARKPFTREEVDRIKRVRQRRKKEKESSSDHLTDDGDVQPDYMLSQVPKHWRDPDRDRQRKIFEESTAELRHQHPHWRDRQEKVRRQRVRKHHKGSS
jgi:hypothetical protein